MLNLVGGEQPPEDFGRRISDLFFRKSSLAAVKNDYIFKSFINYSYYATFFIGLKASLRRRSWTTWLIIPLTFWDLDFILSLFFRLRWLMLLSYPILSLGSQLLWEYLLQTSLFSVHLFHFIFSFHIHPLTLSSRFDYRLYTQVIVVIELSLTYLNSVINAMCGDFMELSNLRCLPNSVLYWLRAKDLDKNCLVKNSAMQLTSC